MPHLIDDVASGAALSTMARSSSRMARRCGACLAKNASTGAPRSPRGPYFVADIAILRGGDLEGFCLAAGLPAFTFLATFTLLAGGRATRFGALRFFTPP